MMRLTARPQRLCGASPALVAALLALGVAPAAEQATVTNSIGMEFVLIGPGEMVVGKFEPTYVNPPAAPAAPDAPARGRSYTPEQYQQVEALALAARRSGFTVKLDRSYYMARFEVTQAQWRTVMGSNSSLFQGSKVADDAAVHPVDNVTWDDAQLFIRRLNALEKTDVYRLPTEFEWEYAARAGHDGNVAVPAYTEQAVAGFNVNFTTQPVGQKKPNDWNLYDMLGNVWEWVQDFYNERTFPDPVPPRAGTQHVLKGGSFLSASNNTIPAVHAGGPGSGFDVGFRVLREIR